MALRYFYLTAHYRSELNFTWEALSGSAAALKELQSHVMVLRAQSQKRHTLSDEKLEKIDEFRKRFDDALANDMNTPQALAVVWELLKSNITSQDKYDLLLDFDQTLGLGLAEIKEAAVEAVPADIQRLLTEREAFRKARNFTESDKIRDALLEKGYEIEDTADGTTVKKM